MKAPLAPDETERLAELNDYGVLHTPSGPALDAVVRLAARACDVPMALLTLIDQDRQWFKARVGVDLTDTPRDISFCSHAILQPEGLVVPDATQDARFQDNPFVSGPAHVRFYAGVPLRTPSGHVLGTLCVLDRVPRELTGEQWTALVDLGLVAVGQLGLCGRNPSQRIAGQTEAGSDIHARGTTEEALRERERQFKAVTDNVPALIARMDAQRRYLFANRAYQDALGIPPNEMIGKTLVEVLGPEAYETIRPYVDRVLTGEPVTYEAELAFRTVGRRFIHGSYVPEFGANGEVVGFVLSAMDITERRRANEALRESEQRFKSLFQQGPNAIVCVDREWRVVSTNPPVEQLLGWREDELIHNETLFLVAPEDVDRCRAILTETLLGQVKRYELHYRHKQGQLFLVSGWSVPIIVDGHVTGAYLLARDITAQRQVEEAARRLALIVENSHDAIVGTGPDGEIQSWNRGAERLYGYTAEEALGKSVGIVYPTDCRDELKERLDAFRGKDGTRVQEYEAVRVRKDGAQRIVSVTVSPVPDLEGRMTGHAAIIRDITDQKEMETERELMLHEAIARADRDPLTGLLNHRAFHHRLESEADRAQREGKPLAVAMLDLNNFKFFNDAYGHLAGDQVLRLVTAALKGCCRSYDTLARFGGDEFALLLPGIGPDEVSAAADRLRAAVECIGYRPPGYDVEIPLSLSIGTAVFPDDAATRMEAVALADTRLCLVKTGAAPNSDAASLRTALSASLEGFSMLDALVTAVDNKDRYTRRHSEDVMAYCQEIAQELGLADETQHTVAVAALLHDVGKIGVPDAILRKPGRLTDVEFEAMKQHPMMGAIIVAAVPGLEETLDGVRHHHEQWDGQGYPFGLAGQETPFIARLMAVADAFSAMTTDRPYRKGMPSEKAQSVLAAGAGSQWDPEIIAAFLRVRARSPQAAKSAGVAGPG